MTANFYDKPKEILKRLDIYNNAKNDRKIQKAFIHFKSYKEQHEYIKTKIHFSSDNKEMIKKPPLP